MENNFIHRRNSRKGITSRICLTLDLEEDFAGRIVNHKEALDLEKILILKKFLNEENIPLSIFVQGSLLSDPSFYFLSLLATDNIEFHLHSHKHNFENINSEEDLNQGIKSFKDFFGYLPIGYRAPEGRVTLGLLSVLQKKDFLFDSSLFPTFLPKPKYYFNSREFIKNNFLKEVPISGIFFNMIPFSLSWMKLIGRRVFLLFLYLKLKYSSSETLVFSFHMHDLWELESSKKLPFFWRFIFFRNRKNGLAFLQELVEFMKKEDLSFELISKVAKDDLT